MSQKPRFIATVSQNMLGKPPHSFDFRVEKHSLANGKTFDYYVFHLPHFVIVVPKLNDKYVLIKQYRPSWRESAIEFPAGVADSYDEDPEYTAKRELQEETGYASNNLKLIGSFRHTSRSTQWCHSFVADNLELNKQSLDEAEFIEEILFLTPEDIEELIKNGTICDISHIATWYSYKHQFL